MIAGFESGLEGFNWRVNRFIFNLEDYHSEELKGKDVIFSVTINSVKEKKLPELDSEF